MGNIKVSVIIPVYNTAPYLAECLDSVVNQTLREIEIICVDDGSSDGSSDILRKYTEKDARIIVFTQENRGQSAARNKGVANACGKYLYFMDSDDFLELSALETLYEKAEADNLDVIYFDGDNFTKDIGFDELINRKNKIYMRNHHYDGIYEGHALLSKMEEHDEYAAVVWLQFINRNYYVRNKLGFYEGIIFEDRLFSYKCMLSAERAAHLPLRLIHRRIRPDSTITKKISFANVYGYFICYLEMNRFYIEHNLSDIGDEMLFELIKRTLSYSRNCYMELSQDEQQAALALPDELRQPFRELVIDACNKKEKREARRQMFCAPFARLIALKNSVFSGFSRR